MAAWNRSAGNATRDGAIEDGRVSTSAASNVAPAVPASVAAAATAPASVTTAADGYDRRQSPYGGSASFDPYSSKVSSDLYQERRRQKEVEKDLACSICGYPGNCVCGLAAITPRQTG